MKHERGVEMKEKKPNILLITADQFRWDCLGCIGNPVIRTPNLDRLAARGMLFRNAFTPNPICVPARATIMTGNYSQTCTGIKRNEGGIRASQPLLTETLKAAGYRAYAAGKLHFMPYAPPDQPRVVHGFEHVDLHESGRILGQYDPKGERTGLEDYFDYLASVGWPKYSRSHGIGNNDVRPCASPLPMEHHVDHWVADCTIRRLEQHRAETPDQPFFMWMSSPKPHAPYDPPKPYDSMYDPRTIPPPFGSADLLTDRDPFLDHLRYTHALASLSPEAWQVARSHYYGLISFLDEMIGRVLRHLDETGLIDNTLILFTADHGDLIGDFGSGFKATHLNGSVRVPFLVAGPGVAAGQISEAQVGLQDILPTFAEASGSALNTSVHGRSLCTLFADSSATVRERYYSSTENGCGQSAMICDGEWKYIYSEANGTEELYDQTHDRGELHNLAADPAQAGRLAILREQLIETAQEFDDQGLLSNGALKSKPVDRSSFPRLPVKGLGWRWY
jgi:choline-sulfatase